MRIVKSYKINSQSDLIFTKGDIKNFFKHTNFRDIDFFILAVMELGTNILKYPKKGEIWLLEDEGEFILAALDKGEGIYDIRWAVKKGTSSKNTLGIGLYQLSNHPKYLLEILSLQEKEIHGSIVLLRPYKDKKTLFFSKNFLDMPFGGDFVIKKGKYIILGDVGGHGKRAYKTAQKLKEFILNNVFSCLLIDDFFQKLHCYIIENSLRSAVLSVIEITKFGANICGVGTNRLFIKDSDLKSFSFKEGILGEVFSSSSKFRFDHFDKIFLTTDGIDEKLMYNILNKNDSIYLSVIGGVYFSEDTDDRTVIGVKNGL